MPSDRRRSRGGALLLPIVLGLLLTLLSASACLDTALLIGVVDLAEEVDAPPHPTLYLGVEALSR